MLAHNAAVLGVGADLGRLLDEPLGGDYERLLDVVTDAVGETRERAQAKAEAEANARR